MSSFSYIIKFSILSVFLFIAFPSFSQTSSTLKSNFITSDSAICINDCVNFFDKSSGGTPTSWSWTFTGGTPAFSIQKNPTNICYKNPGTYDVKLIVSDGSATQTRVKTGYIVVTDCSLKANFVANDSLLCIGDCINFSDKSIGTPTSWAWTFTGGTPAFSTQQNPKNICYNLAGTYDVKLIVSNGSNTQTRVKTAYVKVENCNVAPVANFQPSQSTICSGQCISFSDESTNSPTSWKWTFNGGTPKNSTDQNPSNICFNTPGTYNVKLVATNGNGKDSVVKKITVNDCPKPNAGFTASKMLICPGDCINFTNTTTGADSYSWSFDHGTFPNTSDLENPANICFDTIGSYFVQLTAFNTQGFDTAGMWILVDSCPSLDIPTAFSPNGDLKNDYFRVVGNKIAKVNVQIYNRWGNLVYEIKGVNDKWDGRYNGEDQPVGVYSFYLDATMVDGTIIRKQGNVTLLR